ncbi:hypothetical protein G3N18_06555 [Microbacterium sp. 2C]|uniref:hypothetical protein n=1 Tax=Microbacterium paulum TaxID=2707006 RepID=UPI0018C3162F|nr:hypothetical protein [Microbacterium paulum]MBG0717741.1 hypothetical protein [Microbacterium paulum]
MDDDHDLRRHTDGFHTAHNGGVSKSEIQVQLFDHGGGIVVGTSDIQEARMRMRKRIQEEWETSSPVPWQMYDFTYREPHVELGRIVEDPADLDYARWVRVADGVPAVVWR